MARVWRSLVLLLLACTLATVSLAQDRSGRPLKQDQKDVLADISRQLGTNRSFALVIGISEFDRMPRLRGTQPEAEIAAAAFARQGFQVERVGESGRVSKEQLKGAIAKFLGDHGGKAANRLIIYVATHGYAADDKRDLGFLAASDTLRPGAAGFEASAYSVRELSAALAGLSAQHIYLFFNSCFSGAMLPDLRNEGPRMLDKPGLLKALSPEAAQWTTDLLSRNARLALTAGSDNQTVPDVNNPYSLAVAKGLEGEADADGDGIILGTELAQFVRGRVARETRKKGKANDAVFAVLEKKVQPAEPREDAPANIDYGEQGDFVFLSPKGPRDTAVDGRDELAEILAARAKRLPRGQFVDCADCPVMVEMPGGKTALGKTEVTFAEWDACYREFGCRRFLPDSGLGRGDRPAAGMTWQDAYEFHVWLNSKEKGRCGSYRLPDKAEWLAGAGVGVEQVSDIAETGRAHCAGCGGGRDETRAISVATLPANVYGLNDVEGNLWEWVEDGPACGPAEFSNEGMCKADGTVMGGSFATAADELVPGLEAHLPRTSNEWPWSPPTVGLRIACNLKQ